MSSLNKAHIELQYKRLEKHFKSSLENKDEVSFLDLTHSLRIWTELKYEVDKLFPDKLSLPEEEKLSKNKKKFMKNGSEAFYLTLGIDMPTPIKIKGPMCIKGTPQNVSEWAKQLYKEGPPNASYKLRPLTEWLDKPAIHIKHPANNNTEKINKECLIKRVANLLGASHPFENRKHLHTNMERQLHELDKYITPLKEIKLNGYPAHYYLLLEIAKAILDGVKVNF